MNMGSEDVNEDLFGLEDEDFGKEINNRMNITNISSEGSNQGESGSMINEKINQSAINDAYKRNQEKSLYVYHKVDV
ncbi:hypothetical protein AAG906_006080 [Vitis piasezkii]